MRADDAKAARNRAVLQSQLHPTLVAETVSEIEQSLARSFPHWCSTMLGIAPVPRPSAMGHECSGAGSLRRPKPFPLKHVTLAVDVRVGATHIMLMLTHPTKRLSDEASPQAEGAVEAPYACLSGSALPLAPCKAPQAR